MLKDRSMTSYGAILDYWKEAKKGGWYLPPAAAVKSGVFPDMYKPFSTDVMPDERISVSRAWLYLTKQRGANLKICDPYFDYTSPFDVVSRMARAVTGSKHMHIDNMTFILANGYSETKIVSKLESRYGFGAYIKDPDPVYDDVKQLLLESFAPCQGEYVFPLPRLPFSILTRMGEVDFDARWVVNRASRESLAIAHAVPDDRGYQEDILPDVASFAEHIDMLLKPARAKQAMFRHGVYEEKEIIPSTSQTGLDLQYAISQIQGFMRQAFLTAKPNNENYGCAPADLMDGGSEGNLLDGDADLAWPWD